MRLGRWELVRALGRGGMGEVWLARDPSSGQEAALKLLLHDPLDAESMLRFTREAQALRGLRHPAIVPWLESGRSERGPWIAMEHCPGGSLEERIRVEPLGVRQAAEIARDLAEALAHAHAAGVLHRDVKPANVLFDRGGNPRLGDFGLARPLARGGSVTGTGTIMGSPGYIAPEQVRGDKAQLGPATDVYGLGATLFHMLVGGPPFTAPSVLATLEAVLSVPPSAPSSLRAGIPAGLDAIVLRCLAKSPQDRYPSALALREALQGFLSGGPPAPAVAPRARASVRAAVAVGLVVAVGAFLATRPGEEAEEPHPAGAAATISSSTRGDVASQGRARAEYPAAWWEPKRRFMDWEVLPHQAAPGEVIISRHTELRALDSLSPPGFELHRRRYACLMAFWQAMKYPEGPEDARAEGSWPHTRADVAGWIGQRALRAGEHAEAEMRRLGIEWVSYQGEQIPYGPAGENQLRALIEAACRAKLDQNPEVRRVLLATGDLRLRPDHRNPLKPGIDAWPFHEIWMQLREELRRAE